MQSIKYGKWVLLLVVVLLQNSFSAVFPVAKSGQTYTTIQAAVNATKKPGDEVVIMDDGVYAEQVIIDSTKNGIILRSNDIFAATKPTIKWQDKVHVGPKTNAEAKVEANITFDRNGALIVLGAKSVRIEGIAVDGGGAYPFGYPAIWDGGGQMWPLLHGNGGISLWIASDAIIRYCDISNAYFGINVKDRNIGGVFANPNPSDIDSLQIVPFAGFAETGNHLIEHNRIHNNSYGMYFESCWDLGSTIRYNLFYENHHTNATEAALAALKDNGEVGNHVGGGAFLTKDHLLSPLAIHNNTFWHNRFMFAGVWKAGGQHLIFNNIFGAPDELGSAGSNLEMTKSLANRIHNSVYAAQAQLTASYISILNDLAQPKAEGDVITGAAKPFPAEANNIYLETKFISTVPTSPNFLEPDWTNANIMKYIVDQGWEEIGIKDPDGSRADLGAIPSGGGKNIALVTIRPSVPIITKSGTAEITFNILPRIDAINNPVIKYLGVVTQLDTSDVFGNAFKAIPKTRIIKLTPGSEKLKEGSNTIKVPVSATLGEFAFFEMVIEGTDSDGEKVTTSVGFIPYRKIDTKLEVTVQDATTGKTLTEVKAGTPVKIHIVAYRADGTPFTGAITPLVLFLGSSNSLWTVDDKKIDTLHGQMPSGVGDIPAVFHTVPIGGIDQVKAAGTAKDVPFFGASADIKILPGDPAKVEWTNPQKGTVKVVNTNQAEPLVARVFDKYDNLITVPSAKVKATSLQPNVGTVTPDIEVETNVTGDAVFLAVGTGSGNKGDTFRAVASLAQTNHTDTAICIIGEAKDQFFFYYGDTAKLDLSVKLSGCSGDRLPVVIRALKAGKDISIDKNTSFEISVSSGLAVYADETSTEKIFKGQLVNGQTKVWVQGIDKNVANGKISARGPSNISAGERQNIFFEPCENAVATAKYFADNGIGSVNRLEVFYRDALTAEQIPDSLELAWPEKSATTRVMVKRDGMVQDPADTKHITVTITPPFAPDITKSSTQDLGMSYWFNPKTPDAKMIPVKFNISDGVGPLIQSAELTERLSAGNDVIDVTFTESVAADLVKGITLYLIKNGTTTPVELTVLSAVQVTQTRVKIEVNVSDNPPKKDDSLKIIATGTIADVYGNKAHVTNRPAWISEKAVPADIEKAVYLDKNSDGRIDAVKITFKKNIDPTGTAISISWNEVKQKGQDFIGDKLVLSEGNKVAEIALDESTFGYGALKNKTYGRMEIKATFILFPVNENTRNATAIDGAAPVIDSARYHFGRLLNGNKDPDTLLLHFTETLEKEPLPPDQIVVNATGEMGPYSIKYSSFVVIQGDGFYKYIVDAATSAIRAPAVGDSVYISVVTPDKNVVDPAKNAQADKDNRRVEVVINILPASIVMEAGPLPYMPGTGTMTIQLRPIEQADQGTVFDVSFTIYDKVGNVVKRFPEAPGSVMNAKGKATILWDGTNLNNRKVGSGTYLCCANGKYVSNYKTLKMDDKVKIGIQLSK